MHAPRVDTQVAPPVAPRDMSIKAATAAPSSGHALPAASAAPSKKPVSGVTSRKHRAADDSKAVPAKNPGATGSAKRAPAGLASPALEKAAVAAVGDASIDKNGSAVPVVHETMVPVTKVVEGAKAGTANTTGVREKEAALPGERSVECCVATRWVKREGWVAVYVFLFGLCTYLLAPSLCFCWKRYDASTFCFWPRSVCDRKGRFHLSYPRFLS